MITGLVNPGTLRVERWQPASRTGAAMSKMQKAKNKNPKSFEIAKTQKKRIQRNVFLILRDSIPDFVVPSSSLDQVIPFSLVALCDEFKWFGLG